MTTYILRLRTANSCFWNVILYLFIFCLFLYRVCARDKPPVVSWYLWVGTKKNIPILYKCVCVCKICRCVSITSQMCNSWINLDKHWWAKKFLYVCTYMSVWCMQAQFHLVIFFLFMLLFISFYVVEGMEGRTWWKLFAVFCAKMTGLKSSKYIPKKDVCEFPHTLLMKALSAAKTCWRAASDWPTLRNVR